MGSGHPTFIALLVVTRVLPSPLAPRMPQTGFERVVAARHGVLVIPADLVVVSPLTRAIQTAVGLFGEADVPIIVTDLHRERLENSCDIGRAPTAPSAEVPVLTL